MHDILHKIFQHVCNSNDFTAQTVSEMCKNCSNSRKEGCLNIYQLLLLLYSFVCHNAILISSTLQAMSPITDAVISEALWLSMPI